MVQTLVVMKEGYLEEGKFICDIAFHDSQQQVPYLCLKFILYRKSNGSDPENDESRSSKMVCLHQPSQNTLFDIVTAMVLW